MDRVIIYPGQVPLETDLLQTNKFAMVALSKLAAAILGTATLANGFSVVPTGPASLSVNVNPGEIYSLQNIDGTAYSSIAADTTHSILKQGISLDVKNLACAAPGSVGQSINYLVQATYTDSDSGAIVLPYYNASNPAVAYSGPGGTGVAQNTLRQGLVTLQAKAGVSATTGSQATPAPDAGFIGLYVVTVANGQATITAGNITAYAGAPIIGETLTQKISQATADSRYAQITSTMKNGYMYVRDEKTTATNGGSSVVGSQTRSLNTVVSNTIGSATLNGSSQVSLPAGTYRVWGRAPVQNVDGNKAVLYNVTDSVNTLVGSSNDGLLGQNSDSFIVGQFTIAATKVFEVRHFCVSATTGNGLGGASNVGSLVEVYTELQIEQIS